MKTKLFIDEEDVTRQEQEIDIIQKLGEGNQAIVYLVRFEDTDYALKLYK
eukprot:CAMPEP_0168323444 /NCGR_PEP_ID=MMETSP0213-20121227/3486_1 /TAXON_ID=151035 /ORGANISM="Euplotes harpa, Strain FSP1.4" /LENGTH=49 /DNA_ID=CAMNT_0008325519 /DNA_START=272 /DNA_END=421 /DNA_ORIENTATION=+